MLAELALGKSILASKHNLNGEFVSDGFNGYLFCKDDDIKLVELIIHLYENQNKLVEFGNNSLQIADRYRVEKVLNDINIFEEKGEKYNGYGGRTVFCRNIV